MIKSIDSRTLNLVTRVLLEVEAYSVIQGNAPFNQRLRSVDK